MKPCSRQAGRQAGRRAGRQAGRQAGAQPLGTCTQAMSRVPPGRLPAMQTPAHALEWQHRLPLVVAEVAAARADVVCLQEANHTGKQLPHSFPATKLPAPPPPGAAPAANGSTRSNTAAAPAVIASTCSTRLLTAQTPALPPCLTAPCLARGCIAALPGPSLQTIWQRS